VRQEEPFVLKDNMLINVGEAYMVVNILSGALWQDQDIQEAQATGKDNLIHLPSECDMEHGDETSKLKLKIFGGPSAGEVYFYKGPLENPVLVGRTPECHIKINDKLLSKTQAHVEYCEESD